MSDSQTSNLLSSLRDDRGDDPVRTGRLMEEAANEIERLTRQLAMSDAGGKLALAERDRLRAALVALSTEAEGLEDTEWVRKRVGRALAGSTAVETSAGRTPQDYAIEHAGYLADAVGQFLEVLNECDCAGIALSELDEDDEEYDDASQDVDVAWEKRQDHLQAVQNAVYEFRKRAERAKGSAVKASEHPLTPSGHCTSPDCGNSAEKPGTCTY